MDNDPLKLIQKVWQHSGINGNVWMPSISKIGTENEKFRQGADIHTANPVFPELRDSVDWYWTPAVSGDSRLKRDYEDQRVLWVDCDESYNLDMLKALKPSLMWETSPGHTQAVWLMTEPISKTEFHRDGLMGLLAQAIGADKSGVDIPQLLRVPGTWHHKRKPFKGRVLSATFRKHSRGQLLTSVAKALGFPPGVASDLGADDPFGDRSVVLWKINRTSAELGLPEDLAYKLAKACKWNKWRDDPEALRGDVRSAYARGGAPTPGSADKDVESPSKDVEEDFGPWDMAGVADFGRAIRTPTRWVVPNIIPEGGCGLLVAAPKVGKTRLAIELALGVATGRKPLGLSVAKQQAVGFLSLEDGQYLYSIRLDHGINESHGRERYHWDGVIRRTPDGFIWSPATPMPLYTNFEPVDLSEAADQQRLYETILQYDLKLVIIDTLSMAIGKANVSDQKDMYSILKPIKEIAKATGCAVMFIHHTRKRQFEKGETIQETILGATALHGWSDFIMSLASPAEGDDLLRLGVQTKMGNDQHYVSQALKIIKRPPIEEV